MDAPKRITVQGHLIDPSPNPDELRRVSAAIYKALAPNCRVSPPYPRDRGRPGWIIFITVWDSCSGSQVVQKPLTWEVEQ